MKHNPARGVSQNETAVQRSFGKRDRDLSVRGEIPCLVDAYVSVGLPERSAGSQEYKQRGK
jgi:hypothetical protein